MNAALFEPRPLYGIGTVARLTGLKPDTLRVWERRYGLGASHKSPTGRRQYTQSDLEHLQLVASLVNDGARIGEIAKSERKTLEMLLKQRGVRGRGADAPAKPRAVFVGVALCDWLDKHQGCVSNVNAHLARVEFSELSEDAFDALEESDVLVVECGSLGSAQVARIRQFQQAGVASRIIVAYRFGNDHWIEELEKAEIAVMEFPPDSGKLAFEIARGVAESSVHTGETNLGELMPGKARHFKASELAAAANLKSALDCECPKHISDLITALADFEEYSSSCSVDNWKDAAVHSCIYAYTAQARHLMEKALQAVLEDRGAEFQAELNRLALAAGGLRDVS
ncbi:MerR family transcriptional regulator [Congregibacter litoralis]|uniref:Putative transcriptional regulator n=1 Tax=Congregibacter litoralis KT71 TaxID=314285 RepID=A4A8B7_9GAMM|nr:MerR family transcriptional regulator [Congregibacter litoralis]EAQ97912.1 putative transcriptional regulator [Congregibacter litoralis KT71]